MDENIFARIEHLFDIGLMADAEILVAGCGSGGGSVALQLAMSGLKNFTLIDNDTLDPENVIRHICGLRYVGQNKVDAVADVLRDRNPKIKTRLLHEDLLGYEQLESEIRRATVVVLATDNEPTRYMVNEICVKTATPFVVGKVFTRGIGGEVFAFRPEIGGCLACLESRLERTRLREGVREIDLVTEEERNAVYGLEAAEIKDSPGLNVDISFITAFHTRFVLDAVASRLPERPKYLSPIGENYVIWGNRPIHPFSKNFELSRITLTKQEGCLVCGGAHGT
jgi:molybdopterin/thiamine biosynthesis adenylyltransferase